MTFTYEVIKTVTKYPSKTDTFPLQHPLSNNSVHPADVRNITWLSLLNTNLPHFIQLTNKQINKHSHSPFTILSVTILFTLLIN